MATLSRLKQLHKLSLVLASIGVLLTYITLFSQISVVEFITQQSTVKSSIERNWLGVYLSAFAYLALVIGATLRYYGRQKVMYVVVPFALILMQSTSYWGRLSIVIGILMVVTIKLLALIGKVERGALTIRVRAYVKWAVMLLCLSCALFCSMSWTIELRLAEYSAYDLYPDVSPGIRAWFDEHSFLVGSARSAVITYGYLTTSIRALDYWTSAPSDLLLGQLSFPYFARLANKVGMLEGDLPRGDEPLHIEDIGIQLPSALAYGYRDFGLLGVVLMGLIIGYSSTANYCRQVKAASLATLLKLSFLYVMILVSPFILYTQDSQGALTLVLFWWVASRGAERDIDLQLGMHH
jgi:hypothetical protein